MYVQEPLIERHIRTPNQGGRCNSLGTLFLSIFEQSSGRQACNNPYNRGVDEEMFKQMESKQERRIPYKEFLALIQPSCASVDSLDDMDAIMARTHMVVITDHGVYWRVAHYQAPRPLYSMARRRPPRPASPRPSPHLQGIQSNPRKHSLPPNFDAGTVWSQTILRRLVAGEPVPKFETIITNGGLFGDAPAVQYVAPPALAPAEAFAKVKLEKTERLWRNLKRQGPDH